MSTDRLGFGNDTVCVLFTDTPYSLLDIAVASIEDQRQAEIAAYRAARLLAACNGDQRLADAQRFLDMFPALRNWAYRVATRLGTALTNGILSGIRPGVHLRFRPPRRVNRRAHSRKAKRV